METFSALLALVTGIHRSPMNSPHKSQWRRALIFSLICAWTNGWANHGDAGDLRRNRAHYGITVMHHSDIGVAALLLKSLDSLFNSQQRLAGKLSKLRIFAGLLWEESPTYRRIPTIKGQLCGRRSVSWRYHIIYFRFTHISQFIVAIDRTYTIYVSFPFMLTCIYSTFLFWYLCIYSTFLFW